MGRITADFLGHKLLWYKDKTLPAYLSAAACLLLKDVPGEAAFEELIAIL